MSITEIIIFLGAITGGFVSGLTGFGTGLTVLPFWLLVTAPSLAAPLVIICSVVGQLQTLPTIWRAIEWRKIWPYLLGGLFGIPIGTALLLQISPTQFKMLIGVLLIGYCVLMLFLPSVPKIRLQGPLTNGLIGLGGGVLGGLAGLSGVLPSVWATLHEWGKEEARSVFQTFNLTILFVAGLSQIIQGLFTRELVLLAIIAIPGTIIGAWFGKTVYLKISDDRYNKIILILLLFAGVSMIGTTILG
ncbi:MAG: sulfite exporter TauE/SafE family protein [Rhizobiaceae bacterium]